MKLYYPTLVFLAKKVCLYAVRYQTQLRSIILGEFGAPGVTAFDLMVSSCQGFLDKVTVTVNP